VQQRIVDRKQRLDPAGEVQAAVDHPEIQLLQADRAGV
jgi:hypothetical protein